MKRAVLHRSRERRRRRVPGILLAVVGGQLPFVLGLRTATLWVLVQSWCSPYCLLGGRWALVDHRGLRKGFSCLPSGQAMARRESDARRELAATHAELVATQALLAESARERRAPAHLPGAPRLRGTPFDGAQLAAFERRRAAEGEQAKAAVVKARAIAGELLGEVRDTVRALRETRQVELEPALQALAQAASGLKVTIRVDLSCSSTRIRRMRCSDAPRRQ
ncbi:MAG: hypothetical protein R3B07_21075 [Polyangiaceae bacterium]